MTPLWQQKRDLMDAVEREYLQLYNNASSDVRLVMVADLVRALCDKGGSEYMRKWLEVIAENRAHSDAQKETV